MSEAEKPKWFANQLSYFVKYMFYIFTNYSIFSEHNIHVSYTLLICIYSLIFVQNFAKLITKYMTCYIDKSNRH